MAAAPAAVVAILGACRLVAGVEDLQITGSDGGTDGGTGGDGTAPCGDTSQDSQNCGACGHSCLGGACKAGACQPAVVFTKGGDVVNRMVVDGPDLYVAFSLAIVKCPVKGCGTTPTAIYTLPALTTSSGVLDMVLDPQTIYFLLAPTQPDDGGMTPNADGGPWRVGRDGSNAKALTLGQLDPRGIALANGTVYWTDDGDPSASTPVQAVLSCPTAGCANATTVATSVNPLGDIVADAQNVYFPSDLTLADGGTSGALASCGLGKVCGKTPAILYTGTLVDGTSTLAFDGTTFFASSLGDTVAAIDLLGAGKALAAGQPTTGLVADADDVYFTRTDTGNVLRLPRAGGVAPTPMAMGQSSPNAITADATAIYWANDGDGTIMRLAK